MTGRMRMISAPARTMKVILRFRLWSVVTRALPQQRRLKWTHLFQRLLRASSPRYHREFFKYLLCRLHFNSLFFLQAAKKNLTRDLILERMTRMRRDRTKHLLPSFQAQTPMSPRSPTQTPKVEKESNARREKTWHLLLRPRLQVMIPSRPPPPFNLLGS